MVVMITVAVIKISIIITIKIVCCLILDYVIHQRHMYLDY